MKLKKAVLKAVTKFPAYKVLPPGGLRTYAALKYHSDRKNAQELAEYIDSIGGVPTRYYSVAIVATRSVFLAGADDAARDALTSLIDRFPEHVEPRCMYSEFLSFHGDYDEALQYAREARLLQPSFPRSLVREVQTAYAALDKSEADDIACAAIARMPRNSSVLWAVAKTCDDEAQYRQMLASWEEATEKEEDLLHAVRQLAHAAGRVGLIEEAMELYRKAMRIILSGATSPKLSAPTKLAGRGAWSAISDLHDVLSKADIPHFFAAGTALGLVREGRPLSADGDIDLGVFQDDFDRDRIAKIFADHPRFEIVHHPRTDKVGLRHRGGSPIDIFPFYEDDGNYYHDGVFVRWKNSPFSIDSITASGVELPVPSDQEKYLTENYGDWRTPYSGFDAFIEADAPNVEVTDRFNQRLHFIRRGYRCLTEGDLAGVQRELNDADETDLASAMTGG